jgi:hypothetical protein
LCLKTKTQISTKHFVDGKTFFAIPSKKKLNERNKKTIFEKRKKLCSKHSIETREKVKVIFLFKKTEKKTMTSSKLSIADFVKQNTSDQLDFRNLAQVHPASPLVTKRENEDESIAKSRAEFYAKQRDDCFQKIFYLFIESESVLAPLKEKLSAAFFREDKNDSHELMITADAEWYQPKAAHFTSSETKLSMLQIGLKMSPIKKHIKRIVEQQLALLPVGGTSSSPAASSKQQDDDDDDQNCLVLVFDLLKFSLQENQHLRSFLAWLFKVTRNQPRLFYDARCDAKVLEALGINLHLEIKQLTDVEISKSVLGGLVLPELSGDKIIDLQLVEILLFGASIRPPRPPKNPTAFLCSTPGMARTLEKFPNLAWLREIKQAHKIRDNAERMAPDHFLKRPIDGETMTYTVADAGMLFNLFEEMLQAYQRELFSFGPATAYMYHTLLIAGDRYATLPRTGVEPKYDDNAYLPLGIFDRIDGKFKGNQICSKCKRAVSMQHEMPCIVCHRIELTWVERD